MAKATDNGWDFVQVGKTYFLIESGVYSLATVLDNYSTSEYYYFKMRFEKSTVSYSQPILEISHQKNYSGGYSGMVSIFELEEFPISRDINWKWEFNNYKIDFNFDSFIELVNDPEKAAFVFESCINPDFFKNKKHQQNRVSDVFLNLFRKKQIPEPSIAKYILQLEPDKIWVSSKNPDVVIIFTRSKNNTIEFDLECPLLGTEARNVLFSKPHVNVDFIYSDISQNISDKLQMLIDDFAIL
jgi:hypothetical protein